jgi:NAD(P)-dependent dehydrogenase (short-subunit alcohol dehydrogenase family)
MTVVVTGANRGLGYETALALAGEGARTVVLAGRDLASLGEARQRMVASTGNDNLVPMHLELASLASVRAFVAELRDAGLPPLRAIICNAGISKASVRERSADGYEVVFATNHLGHFLLVNLLLDQLQAPARILFVSSGVHDPANAGGRMQPPRYVKAEWLAYPERDPGLPADDSVAGGQAYASSKLCNVLCTYELARRLDAGSPPALAPPITVNAFNPGLMAGTGLGRDSEGLTRIMWYQVMPLMSRFMPAARTAAQSGADLAYLATEPALAGVTGKYYDGREMVSSSADSYDLAKAADLWQTSVALSHLEPRESALLRSPSHE